MTEKLCIQTEVVQREKSRLNQKIMLAWSPPPHQQSNTPRSGQTRLKAQSISMCTFFQWKKKQAMSYICNKLSSVFHTRQKPGLKKKVFTRLHCAVLHMHNTLTVIWSGRRNNATQSVRMSFFPFFLVPFFCFSMKNTTELIKQVRGSTWEVSSVCTLMPKAMLGAWGPDWRRGAAKDKALLHWVQRGGMYCFLWGAGVTNSFKRDFMASSLCGGFGWNFFFFFFLPPVRLRLWKWSGVLQFWKHQQSTGGTYDSGGPQHLKKAC